MKRKGTVDSKLIVAEQCSEKHLILTAEPSQVAAWEHFQGGVTRYLTKERLVRRCYSSYTMPPGENTHYNLKTNS